MSNPVLPATGTQVATETINGVDFQKIKLIDSTTGSEVGVGTEANPLVTKETPFSFLTAMAMRALAKFTYTLTGLRVDCGGSSVAISSGTVTTVTTVATMTSLAGIFSPDA